MRPQTGVLRPILGDVDVMMTGESDALMASEGGVYLYIWLHTSFRIKRRACQDPIDKVLGVRILASCYGEVKQMVSPVILSVCRVSRFRSKQSSGQPSLAPTSTICECRMPSKEGDYDLEGST